MNPAHEIAAETETGSPGAAPSFDHKLDEHPALEDFQRLLATDSQAKSAPERQAERRVLFGGYLVAICIGVDDTAQRQQIALSLAALRQTVEQIAAGQDKTAREINKLGR